MGNGSSRQTPTFHEEAVRLMTTSGTPVARDLGVSYQTLRNWSKQAAIDAGERQYGLTTEERAELRQLRRKLTHANHRCEPVVAIQCSGSES